MKTKNMKSKSAALPESPPARKKPGRVANPDLVVTSLTLEGGLITWGKGRPEGLAGLVRRLLKQEYKAVTGKEYEAESAG